MDIQKPLKEAGLSEGETKVYLALLKLGSTTVNKIKEKTKIHRTTIYDFLEKLINKGLVNYVVQNNVNYYSATNPNKLLDLIKEKEDNIKEILPQLKHLAETKKEKITVGIYKGEEGFKTILNDMIRTKKDIIAFGVNEEEFKKRFPFLMEQYFRKEKENKIRERILTSEETKFIFKNKTITYRFIPKNFFNPTSIMIYGNKIVNLIWEPFTIILIENTDLADNYKKHFEILWKTGNKYPKNKANS